jgi:hypothetical protein
MGSLVLQIQDQLPVRRLLNANLCVHSWRSEVCQLIGPEIERVLRRAQASTFASAAPTRAGKFADPVSRPAASVRNHSERGVVDPLQDVAGAAKAAPHDYRNWIGMIVNHAATIAHQSQHPNGLNHRLTPSVQTMQISAFYGRPMSPSQAWRPPSPAWLSTGLHFGKNAKFSRARLARARAGRGVVPEG